MDKENMYFTKLNGKIFRNIQMYMDKVLKEYELSSGSYPYLLELYKNEGISQNKISKEVGNDKAMSARTVTKLIDLDYVYKSQNELDSRAYKLYLTEKAKAMVPKIREELDKIISIITEDLSQEEKFITMNSLNKILNSVKKLNERGGL